MKLLIHHHKYGNEYWDFSTPEQEEIAWRGMFQTLVEFEAYIDAIGNQKSLFKKACKGNITAIKTLLQLREDYEYEGFTITETRN